MLIWFRRRSSVVEKVLLEAQEEGKKFSVIVVDSKPLLEGSVILFPQLHVLNAQPF